MAIQTRGSKNAKELQWDPKIRGRHVQTTCIVATRELHARLRGMAVGGSGLGGGMEVVCWWRIHGRYGY